MVVERAVECVDFFQHKNGLPLESKATITAKHNDEFTQYECVKSKMGIGECEYQCIPSNRGLAACRTFSLGSPESRRLYNQHCKTKLIGGCRVPVCKNYKNRFWWFICHCFCLFYKLFIFNKLYTERRAIIRGWGGTIPVYTTLDKGQHLILLINTKRWRQLIYRVPGIEIFVTFTEWDKINKRRNNLLRANQQKQVLFNIFNKKNLVYLKKKTVFLTCTYRGLSA